MKMSSQARKNEQCLLVFTGYNPRGVISFLRVIGRLDIKAFLVARDSQDIIFRTKYADQVALVRDSPLVDLSLFQKIRSKVEHRAYSPDLLVVPSTEYLNRFVLSHRESLEQMGFFSPLCEKSVYEAISDKATFGELCEDAGILVPVTLNLSKKLTFPAVAKPIRYAGPSSGDLVRPMIVHNSADLMSLLRSHKRESFFLQEYIQGHSYYLLFYISKNGTCYSYSQENIVQQKGGGSMLVSKPSHIHEGFLAEDFVRLFHSLRFFGLVMVEVRGKGRDISMIEANPRIWGPSQLLIDNCVPFFELFCIDNGFDIQLGTQPLLFDYYYVWRSGFSDLRGAEIIHNEAEWDRFHSSEVPEDFKLDVWDRCDMI